MSYVKTKIIVQIRTFLAISLFGTAVLFILQPCFLRDLSPTSIPEILPWCPGLKVDLGPRNISQDLPSKSDLEIPGVDLGGMSDDFDDCRSWQRVAIIVPYRNRSQHLRIFLRDLHPMLQKQRLRYRILIVEQVDDHQFNRAALFNIGYLTAVKMNYDCFFFHDIDLIPEDERLLYTCLPSHPMHYSVAIDEMDYKLPYGTIFGGVSAMTTKQVETVNGFSNKFWGWGGEDDDMYNRIVASGMRIKRPPAEIARYVALKHSKSSPNPDRLELLRTGHTRIQADGLSSLRYNSTMSLRPLFTHIQASLDHEM